MNEGTIACVAVLPNPWPPIRPLEMLATVQSGTSVRLVATTAGSLLATAQGTPGEACSREFGPLHIPGAARVVLILTWSAGGLKLDVNGVELGDSAVSAAELHLDTQIAGPAPALVLPEIELVTAGSDEERLFLDTLADIDYRVLAGGRYNLIRASGLLRQLLTDDNPLLHVVNRVHHVAIQFETVDFRTPPPVPPDAQWQALDPRFFPGAVTIVCNLAQLLAAPCLRWKGHEATVNDLIRACANAKGGIHLGKAKTENEQALIDWDGVCVLLGEEPSLRAMAGICRIVLSGCRAVLRAIQGRTA